MKIHPRDASKDGSPPLRCPNGVSVMGILKADRRPRSGLGGPQGYIKGTGKEGADGYE